jgi:RimJ/RimL family protein N-acetyltransferase
MPDCIYTLLVYTFNLEVGLSAKPLVLFIHNITSKQVIRYCYFIHNKVFLLKNKHETRCGFSHCLKSYIS